MCLDRWIRHSSSTGGYFECNRYKEIEKVNEKLEDKKSQVYIYVNDNELNLPYSRYFT